MIEQKLKPLISLNLLKQILGLFVAFFLLNTTVLAQRFGVENTPPSNTNNQKVASNPRYIPIESGQRFGIQQVGEAAAASSRQLAVRSAVKTSESMLEKAEKLFDDGKFDPAIEAYQNILNTQPKLSNARLGLGNALLETGQFEKAINQFQEVLILTPNNLEARLDLGVTFYRSGRIDEAIREYKEVISKKGSPSAHFNLAMAYAHQGDFSESINNYQAAIKQRKNYPEACNNLGLIYEVQGNLEEAVTHFNLAIKQNNNIYPLAHYNLGRFYHSQSNYEKAIAEFQLAIKQQANFPEANLEIGNVYLVRSILNDTHELENAKTFYQKAIELRQNYYPLAHDNLAITLTNQGNKQEALKHYRIAFDQYNGYCPETLENLIASLLGKTSFHIGNELSRPDNIGNLGSKKEKRNINKRLVKSLSEYEEFDEKLKDSPDVRYCAGLAYIRVGDLESAIDEFGQAIKLSDDKDSDAKAKLRLLLELIPSL